MPAETELTTGPGPGTAQVIPVAAPRNTESSLETYELSSELVFIVRPVEESVYERTLLHNTGFRARRKMVKPYPTHFQHPI